MDGDFGLEMLNIIPKLLFEQIDHMYKQAFTFFDTNNPHLMSGKKSIIIKTPPAGEDRFCAQLSLSLHLFHSGGVCKESVQKSRLHDYSV
jgi:hypothetical protein